MSRVIHNLINIIEDNKKKYNAINNCLIIMENGYHIDKIQTEFVEELLKYENNHQINLMEFLNNELKAIEFVIKELESAINELEQIGSTNFINESA